MSVSSRSPSTVFDGRRFHAIDGGATREPVFKCSVHVEGGFDVTKQVVEDGAVREWQHLEILRRKLGRKLGWGCYHGGGCGLGLWASGREERTEKLHEFKRNVGDGTEYSLFQFIYSLVEGVYGLSCVFFRADLKDIGARRKLGTRTWNVPKTRYWIFRSMRSMQYTNIHRIFIMVPISWHTSLTSLAAAASTLRTSSAKGLHSGREKTGCVKTGRAGWRCCNKAMSWRNMIFNHTMAPEKPSADMSHVSLSLSRFHAFIFFSSGTTHGRMHAVKVSGGGTRERGRT